MRAAIAKSKLLAAAIYSGAPRGEAAKIGGVTLQIVRDWVLRFNAVGPEGLVDRKAPGQPSRLSDEHRAALARIVEEGPTPAIHGVVRWRIVDLCQWLFETLALTLLRLGADPRWTTWLAVTPHRSGPWPPGFGVLPQGKGDLEERMSRVARLIPEPGPVLIVGADIPGITTGAVARAFRALGDHDAVFGPAADGGYWAVGLRRRRRFRDPFRDVRWSTEHALADSLANLAGASVAMLDFMEDVDDAESLRRQSSWQFLHSARRR